MAGILAWQAPTRKAILARICVSARCVLLDSTIATEQVKRNDAITIMFTGLTVALVTGVPWVPGLVKTSVGEQPSLWFPRLAHLR